MYNFIRGEQNNGEENFISGAYNSNAPNDRDQLDSNSSP